jgi:U3 small nucleolar RNA-associated protein 15
MARQYTYAKFKDKAYCGTFRNDGHLLAAGGEDGLVQVIKLLHSWSWYKREILIAAFVSQVFDPENFGTLRTFRGHLKPVHCVSFKGNTSSLLSGGDDGTLRSWDIATGVTTACVDSAHDDYIRALTAMNELSVCATGRYV